MDEEAQEKFAPLSCRRLLMGRFSAKILSHTQQSSRRPSRQEGLASEEQETFARVEEEEEEERLTKRGGGETSKGGGADLPGRRQERHARKPRKQNTTMHLESDRYYDSGRRSDGRR